ncbi:DUF5667 domain-containing protein [Streptomyces bohaiensis]|uniref:DUF5667 domain-containing protein n=1 Tax=Streptomyces bohaiensis TaxID=1431344 RepID=A0ABX1C939_9ACTN|nr:DUF5667 domain-containing protein [Streptomyces bohaiensis]NJQ15651.1 hypothetical protein [Streptomyces bohaiensis]
MLRSVPTSRRANAFAEALDEPRLGEAPADRTTQEPGSAPNDADQAGLLSLAEELRAAPRPELSAETRTTQRAQLVAAMENAFGGAGGEAVPEQRGARRKGAHRATGAAGAFARLRPKTRLTKGLAAGGLGLGVAAGAFGGAAAASTDALPGDTLYGLKRGMEDLRLDLAGSDADRGGVHLDKASTRLGEARRLMERQRAGDLDEEQVAEVRTTLSQMHSDAAEGHRLLSSAWETNGSIDTLRTLSAFNERHGGNWTELRAMLPPQLHDIGDEVTSVFEAMEDDLHPLQALLPTGRDDPGRAEDDAAPPAPQPPAGTPEVEPSPSAPTDSPPAAEEAPPQREAPAPPEDQKPEREGLLGGGGGGLLDPPPLPGVGGGESSQESPESGSPGPEPDVTIPPLIDGLLPGLGIDIRKSE